MAPRLYRSRSAPSEIPSDGSHTRRRRDMVEEPETQGIEHHRSAASRLQLRDQAATDDQLDELPTASSGAGRTRRYSFPGSRYDRKYGGLASPGEGGIGGSPWQTVKGLLRRISGVVRARVDKTVRLVPKTTRKRVKTVSRFLLYLVCGFTVGAIVASKTWGFVLDLDRFDYPEASGWRAYPYWVHTHDPYAALGLPPPLVPEWGPPPRRVIKQAFRNARKTWHPDHWRQFKAKQNGTDDNAYEKAAYAWDVLDRAYFLLDDFWKYPYHRRRRVTLGPLIPNITADMTRLGLPFIDPTCTPCTWEDAAKKFGKALLRGPEATHHPSRVYCPCPIKKKLEDLAYNLCHLPPVGNQRYYPGCAHPDTPLWRNLRTGTIPRAWRGYGLKNRMLRGLWHCAHVVWSCEEVNRFEWFVEADHKRFDPSCSPPRSRSILDDLF